MSDKEVIYKNYKSLDFITLFSYDRIEDTGDLRYLLKLDDYEDMPEIDASYLVDTWEELKLQKREVELSLNRRNKNLFDDQIYIHDLQKKLRAIHCCVALLHTKEYYRSEEYIKKLSDLGYKLNSKKDYFKELDRIRKQSMNIKTKISIREDDMSKKIGASTSNPSIYKTIAAVEEHTKRDIDIHTITMRKWLERLHGVSDALEQKALKNG